MEVLFIYLLKSAGVLTIFFLAYKFLLQKETFFRLNRHYLLGGIIASLLLPLVVFKSYVYVEPIVVQEPVFYDTPISIVEAATIVESIPFDWSGLLFNIYILGVLIISFQFLIQLFSLYRIVKSGTMKRYNSFKLIEVSEDVSPFSFFNYIIYNPENFSEKELEIILNHEKAHGKQLHSIDILISQLFVIFQWFNPIGWFYKKTIQQNLEFMADREAIATIESKKNYQRTLLKVSVTPYCTSITNNFYNSLIKKRIIMLNQSSSKTRNLWKYSLILPILALFLASFNTKEVTVVKDSTITEFLVEPSSTNSDLTKIEDHFKSNNDVLLKFKDIKRNNSGQLTSISINTKYKSNNRFNKRLSIKSAEGKVVIDAFKLNYNENEQSFVFTRTDVGVPESKIMEGTVKLLSDIGIGSLQSKKDTSLGDNPLYIINGKKVNSNKLSSKKISLDGKIIQLNKKEGAAQYGEEGKGSVLVFDGKTTIKTIQNTVNDVIAKITKDTTKEELDKIQKDLREKGMEFNYSNLDYNSAGEITSIKIKYSDKASGRSGIYHVNGDDDESIKPIFISTREDGGFGIGTSPNGREHEERMNVHTERLEDHKARLEEHKVRIYDHKLKMKEHNEKTKVVHEERMEEHRARMEGHKAKMEVEHEERMVEHKERMEEQKVKMKVEQKTRIKEMKERQEEMKVERKERVKMLEERREKVMKASKERKMKNRNDSSDFEKMYFIEKTTTNKSLNSYVKTLKNQGVDFKFSGVKRNNNGEITRIKLRLDDNNGSKTSTAYDTSPDAIPTIIVGKKDNNYTISSSN